MHTSASVSTCPTLVAHHTSNTLLILHSHGCSSENITENQSCIPQLQKAFLFERKCTELKSNAECIWYLCKQFFFFFTWIFQFVSWTWIWTNKLLSCSPCHYSHEAIKKPGLFKGTSFLIKFVMYLNVFRMKIDITDASPFIVIPSKYPNFVFLLVSLYLNHLYFFTEDEDCDLTLLCKLW